MRLHVIELRIRSATCRNKTCRTINRGLHVPATGFASFPVFRYQTQERQRVLIFQISPDSGIELAKNHEVRRIREHQVGNTRRIGGNGCGLPFSVLRGAGQGLLAQLCDKLIQSGPGVARNIFASGRSLAREAKSLANGGRDLRIPG